MINDMDPKELLLFNHYKQKIENRLFDEYDILGFLIIIREHIQTNNELKSINEIANLIAHRSRDRGLVFDAISIAANNNYALNMDKSIAGYQGIDTLTWSSEWKELAGLLQIKITNETIDDIMLCIFSLLQFSEYNKGTISGTVLLIQTIDGSLGLITMENDPSAKGICFSKWGDYKFKKMFKAGLIDKPVITIRDKGVLHLMCEREFVL